MLGWQGLVIVGTEVVRAGVAGAQGLGTGVVGAEVVACCSRSRGGRSTYTVAV